MMLYKRINTAEGGVTQCCTVQYSNVLNCTVQSKSGEESSMTPQFPALDVPARESLPLWSGARFYIPVIISLVWSSQPGSH